VLFAVQLDLGARVLAEQDLVVGLDLERRPLAVVIRLALPTAMTTPRAGFSLAESGMNRPPAVFSSSAMRFTKTRSFKGRTFVICYLL
jgi:hypothetical protein